MGAISSFVQPLGLACLVPFVLLWIFICLRKEKKVAIYFELAPWSSMRLCLQLEKTFPDLRGWQVELMTQLCFVAYNYEIYDAVGREGWLRTTVSLPQLQSDLGPCIFSEGSAERDVMRRIAEYCRLTNPARETYWSELQKLHRELVTRVKIHSNIIPREAYLEKLNEVLRRQQYDSSPPRKFSREFYPIGVLVDAVEESTSASEKTKEWRRRGGQCVLTRHLRTWNVPHAAPRDRLREVMGEEVSTSMTNHSGAVQEVSWRNGIYARKLFYFPQKFETERDVALRVSHPHVIRPMGQTFDVEGKPCLLMEVLESHLYKYFIEQSDIVLGENSLVKGPVEFLDVLLQIARGLKSLHDAHVVHGDLKPHNILFSHFEISEDVRHFLVKIADFDEAQVVSSPKDFEPSYGTTGYAAPEVLKWTRLKVKDSPFCDPKKLDVDSLPYKLDIYGFGCVAYEVLTGQAVYGGNVIRERTEVVECEGNLTKVKCEWTLTKVVKGTLTPDGSIDTSAIDAEQPKCIVWQNLKKIYPRDLIDCLESCWALNPSERPSSSELCEVLEESKSEMQRRVSWKKRRNAHVFWNFLVPSLITFICCFAASYIDAEKFWNWLENLAVVIAAVALVGFVCIRYHNYSGKVKKG